jgi:Endonuclease/Exonuclease/phosphatase family./Reverse transcriptase (RNA-dependent DNA polymerase).
MNVYSDDHHTAVKFLADEVLDIPNLLYMGGDFNVRDAEWDPSVSSHPRAGQALMDLADSYGLVRSLPALPVPTHYADIHGHANSVIDLIFLGMSLAQVIHRIEPDLRLPSDHAPLLVNLPISPENVRLRRMVLKRDSEEESAFLSSVNKGLRSLDFSGLDSTAGLDLLSRAISEVFSTAWASHARNITVTTRSKEWWNDECRLALETYRRTGERSDWRSFRSTTRQAKRCFFDNKITEIASTNKRPWDLMNWVKQRKLPAVEAIRYQGQPCNDLPDLWNALHSSYNAAANRPVQLSVLDEVPRQATRSWVPFSMLEMQEALKACSNVSAPGPDHITWRYLKFILADDTCAIGILSLANSCVVLQHWPSHFKESVSVIIPKPGKPAYDTPKAFRPIVLLNTLGKLIEKMIARRLQFDAVKYGVLHSNQLGGVSQRSTEDAGLFLTHLVRSGWAKGLKTSVVAFDIAQFFPSLNHVMLTSILRHSGFADCLVGFFSDYLVGRSTQYSWNSFLSGACDADVGVGQGSALSPILSALYIAPLIHLFERRALALKVDTSILSYVDDGLLVSQGKTYDKTLKELSSSYRIVAGLMDSFGLVMEHDKSEIFHFSRAHNDSNPELDLSAIGAPTLKPKTYWRYLGFFFDRRLSFKEHVRYYSTKALSTVKAMGMLGNSTRGLLPLQKRLLYRSCVVPIATYGYRLWFFAGAPTKAQVSLLATMQRKAALWILGAFCTSPTGGVEALAGLIPIHLHLKKLAKRSCLRTATLPPQHALMSLLSVRNSKGARPHSQSLSLLTDAQSARLRSPLLDTEASLLNLTERFSPLHDEARPGCRLLDSFPDSISFHACDRSSLDARKAHLASLDNICQEASSDSTTLIVVTDASAIPPRNMQAVSAAHLWLSGQQVASSKAPAGRTTAPEQSCLLFDLVLLRPLPLTLSALY